MNKTYALATKTFNCSMSVKSFAATFGGAMPQTVKIVSTIKTIKTK